jgi:hypothetical protein
MTEITLKPSLLISSQLPSYITDDASYSKFVSFMEAYYEWMEQDENVINSSRNLLNYQDIDKTTNEFLQYFVNEFLPYFPEETLVDQTKLIKFAKELYQTKGTLASYKFLFRVLYDSDFDVFYTKDAVLRASAGKWYVAKSLRLSTDDLRFLNIPNYRIFGETTKSIATIENSVLSGTKIEVFVSNIERLFQSGEYVRIVDNNNQDVIINGSNLRAKIVGQISQLNIDPNNRGSFYKKGDPVSIYGGLNSPTGIGATATVGQTTAGGVKSVSVINGGFGYREDPNTVIAFSNLNAGAKTPIAHVASLSPTILPIISIINGGVGYQNNDPIYTIINSNEYDFGYVSSVDANGKIIQVGYNNGVPANSVIGVTANVKSSNVLAYGAIISVANSAGSAISNATYIPTNSIGFSKNVSIGNNTYGFFTANPNANANTSLANSLSFISFSTYPISSILVTDQGGGITQEPAVTALSTYATDDSQYPALLSSLGILGPVQIIDGGIGYKVNDSIVFSGGSGYGAYANVSAIDANGKITSISYIQGNRPYSLGGMGYGSSLPALSVNSSNTYAHGASIVVTGTLGTGALLSATTDRAGSITSINIENYGEDYISTPNVSIKVQDIVVSNITISNLPEKGDFIYQGISANTTTYQSYVDSVSLLIPDADPTKSLYNLRLYEYTAIPNPNLPLKIDRNSLSIKIYNAIPIGFETTYPFNYNTNIQGFNQYGDGSAKAYAKFLNGLVIGQGEYLNTEGQPSSFDVLQSTKYNNYTYKITVQKEISKYRDILLNLLHPSGTNLIGRYSMESKNEFDFHSQEALFTGHTLSYYTGYTGSSVNMVSDFNIKSNNILTFYNLAGANLSNIISNTNIIEVTPINGPYVKCEVDSVNYSSNTITLRNSTWLTYGNVAYVQANSGSNLISIISLTGSYDIMNGGNYSDPKHHLKDIVYAGDTLMLQGNSTVFSVNAVDYINNTITVYPNLTQISNTVMTVKRTFGPTNKVRIFGPVGTQYIPELTTETGATLITEDGQTIILG